MSYSLTLSFNNEAEAIEFPLLPEKMEVNESGNNKSYEISQLGEVNVIKSKKLTEISFESLFPTDWFPACNVQQNELLKPSHYIDKISKWRDSKQPMRLVFTGGTMNINLPVSIEKFTWGEEGGAVGDIKYSISFKEYKFYSAKKIEVIKPATTSTAKPTIKKKIAEKRPNTKIKPKTYKLTKNDTLWKVAKKFLGDGSKYKQIQKLNGIKDSELKRLKTGRVIKLP